MPPHAVATVAEEVVSTVAVVSMAVEGSVVLERSTAVERSVAEVALP